MFNYYAKYYDAFYSHKTQEDVDYIKSIISKYQPSTKNVLSFGCGTGRHEFLLSEDYKVTGVDVSFEMLTIANDCRKTENNEFILGDIRNVKLAKKFDTCVSLFHILDYLSTNKDLSEVFSNINEHLNDGGLFIFDVWYGPAVLHIKPDERTQTTNEITKKCTPTLLENKNSVDVKYDFLEKDISVFSETHTMRYYFIPELLVELEKAGFEVIKTEEWITENEPSINTWSVCFVCRKTK